ncbi:hypothetical protein JTE90_013853, partial [Oedothorax gibbosus]
TFSTHHVPRCILQRGEETTRVKGRQASRVGHAHGIQLTPTRSPMLRSQYAPYSPEIIFRDGAARHGAGPLAEKLRREGSRPD